MARARQAMELQGVETCALPWSKDRVSGQIGGQRLGQRLPAVPCWAPGIPPPSTGSDHPLSIFLSPSWRWWEGKLDSGMWKVLVNYKSCIHFRCHHCRLCEKGLCGYPNS